MADADSKRWELASPYLDQALEMEEAERASWLATLQARDPDLAGLVETLLLEHQALNAEGFLEKSILAPRLEPVRAGTSIGPYTVVAHIGSGGMSSVWLAHRADGRFERRVAVKFLTMSLAGGAERFRREGGILGRLAHPHIAELIDAGVMGDQPYLILEYVDGQHIDQYCDQHQLTVEARVRLFLDVLAAVAQAHANLIVHRDIKPSNVLVTSTGYTKLLDFGIAKLLQEEGHGADATQLTREGGGALTPAYAAPEQLTGAPITTATDVYALGVLFYVLLSGQHPAGKGPHYSSRPGQGRCRFGRASAIRGREPVCGRSGRRADCESSLHYSRKIAPPAARRPRHHRRQSTQEEPAGAIHVRHGLCRRPAPLSGA